MNNYIYLIITATILSNGEAEQQISQRSQIEVSNQTELSEMIKGFADNQHLEAKATLDKKPGWWEQSFEQMARLIAFGSLQGVIAEQINPVPDEAVTEETENTGIKENN